MYQKELRPLYYPRMKETMKRLAFQMRLAFWAAGLSALTVLVATAAQAQSCSVWLIESSRFMKVPFGSFMPERASVPGSNKPQENIPTVDQRSILASSSA